MANCTEKKHPLKRNGTSQPERLLPGLSKDFVHIDERSYADWINYTAQLSRYIHYYDRNNQPAGNWSSFMNSDPAAVLASIAVQNIEVYKNRIKKRFDYLKDRSETPAKITLKKNLYELFCAPFTIAQAIDKYLPLLKEVPDFEHTVKQLIKTRLSRALRQLIAYFKGAGQENLLHSANTDPWEILGLPLTTAEHFLHNAGLSSIWMTEAADSWLQYTQAIPGDSGIFTNPAATDEYEQIEYAARHNLFSGIFDQFLFAYTRIVKEASAQLEHILTGYDRHAPHYTLFLSFLRLYNTAVQDLNSITRRHLDFYYKDVLRLKTKTAQPDSVHIYLELARQYEQLSLPAGTLFKAGKNPDGTDCDFVLQEETSFNKASVHALHSIYLGSETDSIRNPLTGAIVENNHKRLFASPVSDSEDGLGSSLQNPEKSWHPFVNRKYSNTALSEIAMPKASIGFAIASHYLFLREGDRKIYLRLSTSNNQSLANKHFECRITTEEGWLQLGQPNIVLNQKFSDQLTTCTEFVVSIPASLPAITGYQEKIHGDRFETQHPVLKLELVNTKEYPYEYEQLRNLRINRLELKTETGSFDNDDKTGVKNLQLAGDTGQLDPSKPFLPFGTQPVTGNRFIIGNKEIFSKKNLRLRLHIEWKNYPQQSQHMAYGELPDKGHYPNAAIKCLYDGRWTTINSQVEPFNYQHNHLLLESAELNKATGPYSDEDESYRADSRWGFISIELTQGFGHKKYMEDLAEYMIDKANDKLQNNAKLPVEPYTPVIQSFGISYSAYTVSDLHSGNNDTALYSLYPFGYEQLQKKANHPDPFLFPQFRHDEPSGTIYHQGEFYIGLSNMQPQQAVNLLVQILEGSSDPLAVKPEKHLYWDYLSNNEWKAFPAGAIQDTTMQLTQSGIVSVYFPADATMHHTILPSGYLWIKAAIQKAPGAVCRIQAIATQAARLARLMTGLSGPAALPLPANSISKLRKPVTGISKIHQPFPSFEGRAAEDDQSFYVRVSERLRHKNRAVTMWDYERLILEAFPEIYKVKCLSHTSVEVQNNTSDRINEVKPGHVLIITIPRLRKDSQLNPLKPYTHQRTLTHIERFLQKRCSGFVTIKAVQPQFEEMRLRFRVRFRPEYRDFAFYREKLRKEITGFLTPWLNTQNTDVRFGGIMHKSTIIDFIEEREYVDYLSHVELFVKINDHTAESDDMDTITASSARSILVSAPEHRHEITEA